MNLVLTRSERRPDGIFSVLTDEQGNKLAVTIEHSYDGEPKLPNGTYTCKRRFSPHFQLELFEVIGVPGHDFIEIHPGCLNRDSDGCICPGEEMKDLGHGEMVTNSRKTFEKIMALQAGVNEFELTVQG